MAQVPQHPSHKNSERLDWKILLGLIMLLVALGIITCPVLFRRQGSGVRVFLDQPPTETPTQTPTSTPSSTPPPPTATSTYTPIPTPTPTPNLSLGNTFDRNTGQPLDSPPADALNVAVDCSPNKLRICISFRAPFPKDAYSYAIAVSLSGSNGNPTRAFLFQRHAGEDQIGEQTPQGVVPIEGGRISYDFNRGILCIEFDDWEAFLASLSLPPLLPKQIVVNIQTYYMQTANAPWTGDEETAVVRVPVCQE